MLSNVLFLNFVFSQKTVPFTFFYSSICRICTQFWTLSGPLSFVLIEISFLFGTSVDLMTVSYIAIRRVNLRLDASVPYRNSYEYIMKDRDMCNPYN